MLWRYVDIVTWYHCCRERKVGEQHREKISVVATLGFGLTFVCSLGCVPSLGIKRSTVGCVARVAPQWMTFDL